MTALLEVCGLVVDFAGPRAHRAVDGVDLTLAARERLAIVGESGSGKSQLLLACVGLLAANGRATGSARFEGRELLGPAGAAATVRGSGIGFVFQDAGGSLTPHRRVGEQLVEVARLRPGTSARDALRDAAALLGRVRLPDPDDALARFPHELSGGMRQRVAIALALMARPRVLFADEPTTSLDLTIQAQYLGLLEELQQRHGLAMIFITHNLGIVSKICDRVAVMYAGRIVETGPVRRIFRSPAHPYTRALLESIPRLGARLERLTAIQGQPPDLARLPGGCAFAPRCPEVMARCRAEAPPPFTVGRALSGADEQVSRCWLHAPA